MRIENPQHNNEVSGAPNAPPNEIKPGPEPTEKSSAHLVNATSQLNEASKKNVSDRANQVNESRGQPRGDIKLPRHILEDLQSCPTAGTGVHNWIYLRAARTLPWVNYDPKIMEQLLEHYTMGCGRTLASHEIPDAVHNALIYLKSDKAQGAVGFREPKWPRKDEAMVKAIINEGKTLRDLIAASPIPVTAETPEADEVIDKLFPGNPLLAIAKDERQGETKPREEWRGLLSSRQFMVAHPMIARTGKTTSNKMSYRSKNNTGMRRFLIVEVDPKHWSDLTLAEQSCHADEEAYKAAKRGEQASIILYLARIAPLALVVDTGGKSLHGWFYCHGQDDGVTLKFMRHAVSLGADSATWTVNQLIRIPGGLRDNRKRQRVLFFNPSIIPTT